MNIDTLIDRLKTYIDRNPKLSKAQVAKKLDMSPSSLSHLLARDFNPTGEQALAILQLTKGKQNTMNTNQLPISDDECLEEINNSVLRRFAKKGMTIKHAQSAFSNDGYLAKEGSLQPDYAKNIEELVRSGRIPEAQDLLNQISKNANSIQQARPNPNGATREPLVIRSSGERATVVGTQAFDHNGRVKFSPEAIAAAKSDLKKTHTNEIRLSHKLPKSVELEMKDPTMMNCDNVSKKFIAETHCDQQEKLSGVDRSSVLYANLSHEDLSNDSGKLQALTARLNSFKS